MNSPLPLLAAITGLTTSVISAQVLEIGSQRELMIDHHLIDSLQGVELRLQEPHNEGVVFAFDRPCAMSVGSRTTFPFSTMPNPGCRMTNGGKASADSIRLG